MKKLLIAALFVAPGAALAQDHPLEPGRVMSAAPQSTVCAAACRTRAGVALGPVFGPAPYVIGQMEGAIVEIAALIEEVAEPKKHAAAVSTRRPKAAQMSAAVPQARFNKSAASKTAEQVWTPFRMISQAEPSLMSRAKSAASKMAEPGVPPRAALAAIETGSIETGRIAPVDHDRGNSPKIWEVDGLEFAPPPGRDR